MCREGGKGNEGKLGFCNVRYYGVGTAEPKRAPGWACERRRAAWSAASRFERQRRGRLGELGVGEAVQRGPDGLRGERIWDASGANNMKGRAGTASATHAAGGCSPLSELGHADVGCSRHR